MNHLIMSELYHDCLLQLETFCWVRLAAQPQEGRLTSIHEFRD